MEGVAQSRRQRGFLLADGTPATGWRPAAPARRFAAWAVDVGLFVVTLGVGWTYWAWRTAGRSTTPGKALFGLTVFATDTHQPASRARMALRGIVYQGAAVLMGLATLGLGWIYVLAGTAGANRRTLYDEWSQVVVLARPARLQ
ncbi:MAG: RDD family protein [Pseudonocardia sp.]